MQAVSGQDPNSRSEYADLAIGTPQDELSLTFFGEEGHVDVIHGSSTGLDPTDAQSWDRGNPAFGSSPQSLDRWSSALATGDFDGNGHADLAVGMVPDSNPGEVDVLLGGTNFDTDGDGLSD